MSFEPFDFCKKKCCSYFLHESIDDDHSQKLIVPITCVQKMYLDPLVVDVSLKNGESTICQKFLHHFSLDYIRYNPMCYPEFLL